jgi:hypothetical protein
MNAPRTPPDPTVLPSATLGSIAVALMLVSFASFGVLASGALSDDDHWFISIWEERMLTIWFAAGFVGPGSGIAALLNEDRSLTTLPIVLPGVPAPFVLLMTVA